MALENTSLPLDAVTFGGLEMELDQVGDRWLAKITAYGVARERVITEAGERRLTVMHANAQRARQLGVRLTLLADAIEAMDADDPERLARIVASLREENDDDDIEQEGTDG